MTATRTELEKAIASLEEEIEELREEVVETWIELSDLIGTLESTLPDNAKCIRCKEELHPLDQLAPEDDYACGNCGLLMTIEEICEEVEQGEKLKTEQTAEDELMLRMADSIYKRHDVSSRCARSLRDSVQASYGVVNEIVKQRSEGMGECALNGAGVRGGRVGFERSSCQGLLDSSIRRGVEDYEKTNSKRGDNSRDPDASERTQGVLAQLQARQDDNSQPPLSMRHARKNHQ